MQHKKIRLSAYIKNNYAKPYPMPKTIIRLIELGELPGSKVGKLWYVHVDDGGNPVRQLDEYQVEALKMYREYQSATA